MKASVVTETEVGICCYELNSLEPYAASKAVVPGVEVIDLTVDKPSVKAENLTPGEVLPPPLAVDKLSVKAENLTPGEVLPPPLAVDKLSVKAENPTPGEVLPPPVADYKPSVKAENLTPGEVLACTKKHDCEETSSGIYSDIVTSITIQF